MEKKTVVRLLLATFFTLTTTATGSTAQQKPTTLPEKFAIPTPPDKKSNLERFFGTIEKVNDPAKTVDIKGKVKQKEKTLTFCIDVKTKITRAKTELKMANLKPGMYVLVEYEEEGDRLIATAIKVAAPKK